MVKDLTVAQNFLLMEEPLNALGMVRGRARDDMVRARLEALGIKSIDPRTEVRRLDLPSRQKIEIARAISGNPRILLLDEPTASLSKRDVQWLGDVIERLKRSGTTVVLISHRMQEVRAFCSALTIFRNGRTVGAYAMNDVADARNHRADDRALARRRVSSQACSPPTPPPRRPRQFSRVEISRPAQAATFPFRCEPAKCLVLPAWMAWGSVSSFWRCSGSSSQSLEKFVSAGQAVQLRSPADAIRCGIGMLAGRPQDRGALPRSRRTRKCQPAVASALSTRRSDSTAFRTKDRVARPRRGQCGQAGAMVTGAEFQRRQPAENCCRQMAPDRIAASCCSTIRRAESTSAPRRKSIT